MRQEVALKRTTNRLTEENAPFYDSSTGIGDLTYTCQALETRSWYRGSFSAVSATFNTKSRERDSL